MVQEGRISGAFAGATMILAMLALLAPTPLQNTELDRRALDQFMVGVSDNQSFTLSAPLPGFNAADEERFEFRCFHFDHFSFIKIYFEDLAFFWRHQVLR